MPVNGSTPDTSLLATSIDWTKEYSRERERVRQLRAGADSLPGRLRLLLDGSQTWLVLIATGISIGLLAGAIDIVSSWLSDLRTGYCSSSSRVHRFYLNKTFCCWGFDGTSFPALDPDCQGQC